MVSLMLKGENCNCCSLVSFKELLRKWSRYSGIYNMLAYISTYDSVLHIFQLVVHTDDGREVTLDWDRVRCFEKEIATMFMLQVKEFKEAL